MNENFALHNEHLISFGLGGGFLLYLLNYIGPEGQKMFRLPSRILEEFRTEHNFEQNKRVAGLPSYITRRVATK